MEPAPERERKTTWKEFLTQHWDLIVAADFFTIEGAVRKATADFITHCHSERNHQGLDNALICPEPEHAGTEGEVHRRERLGGLLNYYYRKAA